MAARKEGLTIAVPVKEEPKDEIRVRIKIPAREDDEASGVTVDKYEHVTISNESGEHTTYIKRGEWVDVTIPVFTQLKNRYPDI